MIIPRRFPVWPRVLAILGWLAAGTSGVLGMCAIGYPFFSQWLGGRVGPDFQDDFAGMLVHYRAIDTVVELATIALAVWLFMICRRLWRQDPQAPSALRRWCLIKLAVELANIGVLFAQIQAHAASRADLSAGEAQGFTLGMTGWSLVTGLTLPLMALIWLILPRVRSRRIA
ncbi:hypothetical protein PHYC_00932 [Phycisphaerales bacterium]|nr:hypothetical protein PHYC_00932 [Phycisphaerales bacterium]